MKDQTSKNDHYFTSNFFLSLKLESDGKEAELPTGNIEKFDLKLQPYGYACRLQLATFDNDEVYEIMTNPKPIKATLGFKPIIPAEGTEPIIEFKGIIKNKNFRRLSACLGKHDQAHRIYEIDFIDSAKRTLEEHRPIDILSDMSMKDVIEKHLNPEVTMNFQWDKLEVKHPVIAFNLERRNEKAQHQQTNFYSFLMWYLKLENGLLEYDYKNHSYTIKGKKKEASGSPLDLPERYLTTPLCILAQSAYYNERTHKHTSHILDEEDKENEHAFASVRQESSDPKKYKTSPTQAQEKVQSTPFSDKNEIEINLIEFANDIKLDKLTPGSFVRFKGDKEGNWTRDPCLKDKNFRISCLEIDASKIGVSEEVTKHIQAFNLSVKIKLEEEDASFVEWPSFVAPSFPFFREGHIFCDIGDKTQSAHQIANNQYIVHLPIDKEIKKIVAPFDSAFSNQFFFPHVKETKVIVSFFFRAAEILNPTGHHDSTRLPEGVQGNQIVFGTNGPYKTFMRHEFVDGKEPLFTIWQSSSETQSQIVQIQEKKILITVEEKDKKTMFVEISDESGITLSREDKSAGSLQQYVLGESTSTQTFKGSDGTSTIVQKPDSISFECKNFSIKSETISIEASDSIMLEGKNKVDAKSKVANIAAQSVKLG